MTLAALHVGCGPATLPAALFPSEEWREIRLDIDPSVKPDVVASITDMPLADGSVAAVFSSHNIEHLHPYDVPRALAEFLRVLRPGGFALVGCPDFGRAALWITGGRGNETAYVAPCGPITPMNIAFGHPGFRVGNPFMAHQTGFTAATLRKALEDAGFDVRSVEAREWELWALAVKRHGDGA